MSERRPSSTGSVIRYLLPSLAQRAVLDLVPIIPSHGPISSYSSISSFSFLITVHSLLRSKASHISLGSHYHDELGVLYVYILSVVVFEPALDVCIYLQG